MKLTDICLRTKLGFEATGKPLGDGTNPPIPQNTIFRKIELTKIFRRILSSAARRTAFNDTLRHIEEKEKKLFDKKSQESTWKIL